jgi:PAS domain S-box-containing protein
MSEGADEMAGVGRRRDDAGRLQRLEDRIQILSETMRAFAEATANYEELLDTVAQRVTQVIGDSCVLHLVAEDGEHLIPVSVHARDATVLAQIKAMYAAVPLRLDEQGAARRILETGEALLVPRMDLALYSAQTSPEYLAHFKAIAAHSVLMVAMRSHGRSVGLLMLRRFAPDMPPFDELDRDFAQMLANHAGLAITNARLLRSAREQARAPQLAAIIESSNDAILAKSLQGTIESWNAGAASLFGYAADEALGQPSTMLLPPERRAEEQTLLDRVAAGVPIQSFETVRVRKDGTTLDVSLAVSPIRDALGGIVGVSTIARDISANKRAERLIRDSLAEKVVMLKEIHHRVKNNLQVVSSILRLHANHITDPAAREAFEASQGRVRSIALLHEKLYQSRDLGSVDLAAYATSLATALIRTYGESAGNVRLEVEGNGVYLPVDLAAPCGLILNELLTNAFKHAFVGQVEQPVLRVLVCKQGDRVELTVADNGVGLPPGFDITRSTSLGMFLAHTLAEQLGGTIALTTDQGARCTLRFSSTRPEEE